MTFTDFEFEEVLDTAAAVYNAAFDGDYKEGIASVVAALLVPDLDEDQAITLVHRALKGSN
jgi:hypothetical protein